jgi:thiamine-phosphate diphosphorylase/hydroxyethylthiazole kinase
MTLLSSTTQLTETGVTVVQYRDKTSDTGVLISSAKELHKICQKHNVPLLINDRVDVALAVDCEGVHLGQDDMNILEARQILGEDKIIGATVSSIEETRIAVERGADYLGIGTLYATNTKKNTKDIIGVNGIRRILYYLNRNDNEAARNMKSVCIGGVNASNLQLISHQLKAPVLEAPLTNAKTIDGVAVVSAIMGASDPRAAASHLRLLLSTPPPFKAKTSDPHWLFHEEDNEMRIIRDATLEAVKAVHEQGPLSHNMTNLVVQNFAASVALAIGASPIMSNNGAEATDLAKIGGGLVINMGTATPDALANHRQAIQAYNEAGGPIVLDPVGAGATSARKHALSFLMASGYFDLIKGNEREIMAVAHASGFLVQDSSQQRGVDSGASLLTYQQKAYIVSRIAAREGNVVLMTGATDFISDGGCVYAISNGHPYLGMVTGSGCTLGTTISAYMAANPGDKLLAAVAAMLHFEIAAQKAAERKDVRGPGTFVPAFIDELYRFRMDVVEGQSEWLETLIEIETVREYMNLGLLREL